MKTYTVLYAQDISHYGAVELEAENEDDIVRAARAYWHETNINPADDPAWSNPFCQRIVQIEDQDRNVIVAEDIPLDDYHLRNGGEADRHLCDAAAGMLETLEYIAGHAWLARTNYGPDDHQSLKHRNSSLNEIERLARNAIAMATVTP